MAVTGSGTISIQDIVDEFGGTAPHSLSEYYRNGAYVGGGNTGVPTSGEISLSDFYGASAGTVITVTQGSTGGSFDFNGFSSTAGSVSPTTLFGSAIEVIAEREDTKSSSFQFWVRVSGTHAKSFFTSVALQGGPTLTSSSATFTNNNQWVWSISDIATWDGTGNVTATFT